MKSIYFRNFLTTALLVFFSFLIISSSFFFLGRGYLINSTRDRMNASADEVSRAASAMSRVDSLDSWDLRLTIIPIANSTSSHILICNHNGLVMNCSDYELYCFEHQGKVLDETVMNVLSADGKLDRRTTLAGFYPDQRYTVAKPIYTSGYIIGYVFVSSDNATVLGSWNAFIAIILAVSFAVMLIAIFIALIYSKKLAKPLDEMTAAARKFAHGDFTPRVKSYSRMDDELGTLVASFNNMADSLESSDRQHREFVANISHELRTPMTTIAGFADGILDGTIPPELESRYLHKIADETRRLSRLVRNMLSLSQAESRAVDQTKRTKFDLSELLLQTLLSFESRAKEKDLDVDPQLPEDPILVLAEKDSITQVLYNLLDNAIKFAEKGSTLTLRLYKKGAKAYVSIKDRGETIPADDLPYIFDRFHKSDRSRSLDKDGVGLGLYLVKTIISSHGEDIAVTSRDGVTEFVFTLPLAQTAK